MFPSSCQFFFAFSLPSGPDMFIIAVLVLLLFGGKKLPTFINSLGRSMGEFRNIRDKREQEMGEAVNSDRRTSDEAPDSLADTLLLWLFGISVLLFILSLVMPSMR
jgi:TatA/E family protein of Tat protein translocase